MKSADDKPSGFDGFFQSHRRNLVRYLSRLVSSSEVAEDLTQEAFARVYVVRDDGLRSPRSFLYRTAHNLAMDHMRHQRVAATEPLNAVLTDTLGDGAPSPETRFAAREELKLIEAAIEELPAKCRMVFILLRFEGRSYKEIACRMTLSETMVRKYAVRGLEHCRAKLANSQGAKSPTLIVNHLNDSDGVRRR